MQILNGLALSKTIKQEIKEEVSELLSNGSRAPHLAAILVGEDGASRTYVESKIKDCAFVGFKSSLIRMSASAKEEEILEEVQKLNIAQGLDGFIVQLPLPKGVDQEKIIQTIDPKKDVDGFHPENFGRMSLGMESFIPATPYGIVQLLERNNIPTAGKHVVVLGRSRIVGLPISLLLAQKGKTGNATVSLLNSHTPNVEEFTRSADIVVAALGIPNYLKADMVKDGVTVVDVGITRVEDNSERGYHLVGDVEYVEVSKKASWITPVPGGVGPMTRAMLLQNTLNAFKRYGS